MSLHVRQLRQVCGEGVLEIALPKSCEWQHWVLKGGVTQHERVLRSTICNAFIALPAAFDHHTRESKVWRCALRRIFWAPLKTFTGSSPELEA